MGIKIAEYYRKLEETKAEAKLESFLSIIRLLTFRAHEDPQNKLNTEHVLDDFWEEFVKLGQPFRGDSFTKEEIEKKEAFKLAKYAPCIQPTIIFFKRVLGAFQLNSSEKIDFAIQMATLLSTKPFESNFGP